MDSSCKYGLFMPKEIWFLTSPRDLGYWVSPLRVHLVRALSKVGSMGTMRARSDSNAIECNQAQKCMSAQKQASAWKRANVQVWEYTDVCKKGVLSTRVWERVALCRKASRRLWYGNYDMQFECNQAWNAWVHKNAQMCERGNQLMSTRKAC
jgi:hypothetical protein